MNLVGLTRREFHRAVVTAGVGAVTPRVVAQSRPASHRPTSQPAEIRTILDHPLFDIEVKKWEPLDLSEVANKVYPEGEVFQSKGMLDFSIASWFIPRMSNKEYKFPLIRMFGPVAIDTVQKRVYAIASGDGQMLGIDQRIINQADPRMVGKNGLTMYELWGKERAVPDVDRKTVVIGDIENLRKLLIRYKPESERKDWHLLSNGIETDFDGGFLALPLSIVKDTSFKSKVFYNFKGYSVFRMSDLGAVYTDHEGQFWAINGNGSFVVSKRGSYSSYRINTNTGEEIKLDLGLIPRCEFRGFSLDGNYVAWTSEPSILAVSNSPEYFDMPAINDDLRIEYKKRSNDRIRIPSFNVMIIDPRQSFEITAYDARRYYLADDGSIVTPHEVWKHQDGKYVCGNRVLEPVKR